MNKNRRTLQDDTSKTLPLYFCLILDKTSVTPLCKKIRILYQHQKDTSMKKMYSVIETQPYIWQSKEDTFKM